MNIEESPSMESSNKGKLENTYSLRVKTTKGIIILNNLKLIGEAPEEGYYNEDEFDYGERLD